MVIDKKFLERRRNAKQGCLESMFDLADCYKFGLNGVEQNSDLFLQSLRSLLNQIEEIRESQYSSALIFYEIMYTYLEQGNDVMADHYHHHLMWELIWDHPSEDLESHFENYQVREIAEYFDKDIEGIIDQIKAFHEKFDPESYKILDINHFFTN